MSRILYRLDFSHYSPQINTNELRVASHASSKEGFVKMSTADINYRSLPVEKRIELVEEIWDSIAEDTADALPLTAEQKAELDRRYAEHLANPETSIPWEVVQTTLSRRNF